MRGTGLALLTVIVVIILLMIVNLTLGSAFDVMANSLSGVEITGADRWGQITPILAMFTQIHLAIVLVAITMFVWFIAVFVRRLLYSREEYQYTYRR